MNAAFLLEFDYMPRPEIIDPRAAQARNREARASDLLTLYDPDPEIDPDELCRTNTAGLALVRIVETMTDEERAALVAALDL